MNYYSFQSISRGHTASNDEFYIERSSQVICRSGAHVVQSIQQLGSDLSLVLFDYEMEVLVNALRRDLQAELKQIEADREWAEYHIENTRLVTRLIYMFDPYEHVTRH